MATILITSNAADIPQAATRQPEAGNSALSSTPTPPAVVAPTATIANSQSNTVNPATSSTAQPSASNGPNNNTSGDDGLSAGAAAGVGIGCVIVGALLGALALWFFVMRKSKTRRTRRDHEAGRLGGFSSDPSQKEFKYPSATTTAVSAPPAASYVDKNLPQPLEDDAISGEMSRLRSSIKNHVQSYYHSSPVNLGVINGAALGSLGNELPVPPASLEALIASPNTRQTILRFCIAWVIISRMGLESDFETTFLPPEVASCIQSMRAMKDNPTARIAHLSKWRQITAALMQPTYGQGVMSGDDHRIHNISDAMELLEAVLRPFATDQPDSEQRRRNLEEILKRAAKFAYVLFSQPSFWQFEWNDSRMERDSLVVFPALLQTADEAGQPLSRPRVFGEMEVVRKIVA
ncbi:hypothetical protein W97_02172 [Coniosporium apollinis CBS 100218]|uniref:Uncharacterized protein n=1 Tax=Coniosporium apollinis (strain CBS 100218) TaxID=1168221 RepID=R7YMR3_CONA1|nr:uncharacterized protein W97_02172 [Coniosporium apollinis CBS 100218]EON62946.1 hypothetical protein W97_02172 [Coniosporium apollinis CBS 100218]